MKQTIAEVQRIAPAERMLGERAGPTLVKLLRSVGDACAITIEEMHVSVLSDAAGGPEPRLHFVISAADIHSAPSDDDGRLTTRESVVSPIDMGTWRR